MTFQGIQIQVFLLLFSAINYSVQWWDVGHMLVAQISELYLEEHDPVALKRAQELVISLDELSSTKASDFVTSAPWPDDIKRDIPWSSVWHYKDLPVFGKGFDEKDAIMEDPKENALSFLETMEKCLKGDLHFNTFPRAFYARFAIHVIGDIHQPLHASGFFNQTYVKGDQGGNKIHIQLQDRSQDHYKYNLHSFWDSGATGFQTGSGERPQRPFSQKFKEEFKQLAEGIMKEFPPSKLEKELKLSTFEEWMKESNELAKTEIYPYFENTNVISQDYMEKARKICRRQVALGGYRLSQFFFEKFGF